MSFPDIPGVEWKFIDNHQSDKNYYAISSDGRVWIGNGNKWNLVKLYELQTGEWAVMLRNGERLDGAKMRTINELMREAFGDSA